jgi:CubicO group peptidase (beta-lactamase class C family)
VARYAQLYLTGGRTPAGRALIRPETVNLFTRPQAKQRALGWEMRDSTTADNAGRLMGPRAFGHTGFTGTSLWIEPDRGLFVVVLTNRVYAPRSSRSITYLKQIRGEIADAAMSLGGDNCTTLAATGPQQNRAC